MARTRVRAARRKEQDKIAHAVASGVYTIARDLGDQTKIRHVDLAFPRPVTAPLVYICEMAAVQVCQKNGLGRERVDELALYLMQGLQESLVAMIQSFDTEHFEAWIEAARMRDLV